MNPMLSKEIPTYQHLLVSHFKYSFDFVSEKYNEILENKKIKDSKILLHSNNNELRCFCCGQIHPHGISGHKDNILQPDVVILSTFNSTYYLAKEVNKDNQVHFCGPCLYALKNYRSDRQANLIVTKNGIEYINTTTSELNEMYEWLLGDFKEPFIMIVNTDTYFEYLSYQLLPTISDEIRVIIYGNDIFYIEKQNLLDCLNETINLSKKYKIFEKTLLNDTPKPLRFTTEFSQKNLKKEGYVDSIGKYYSKYNRETRVIAAKIINKHKKITQGE